MLPYQRTANNQQVRSSQPFLQPLRFTGVKLAHPHFGSPLLSLVPSLVHVVSAACERADNKAPQNGNARSSDVASLPLRLEVYNSALVRPTFYPCLAAGKLEGGGGRAPFLPSLLMAPLTRKIGKSRLPRLRQSRET